MKDLSNGANKKTGYLAIRLKSLTGAGTGGFIGFLAAAVLYSRHLHPWVPEIFSRSAFFFFSFFIIVCGILGYVWVLNDLLGYSESEKRVPVINSCLSGAFMGFLTAAVLYSKTMPSWVPLSIVLYPVVFFIVFAVIGGIAGILWNRF